MFSPAILRAGLAAGFSTALVLTGCGGDSSSRRHTPEPETGYAATLERTTYGVPHITSETYGGLGYGHGYAIAEDNLCVLADAFVTFSGERSKYFGRTGTQAASGTFGAPVNLEADFFFRFIANDETVENFLSQQDDEFHQLVDGFAAGYNRYVREIQQGDHANRHLDCRSEEWLREITEQDMYRRLVVLNLAASSSNWVEEIASAAPPSPVISPTLARTVSIEDGLGDIDPERFVLGRKTGIGSNTYSFGSDATGTNSGINFANPHWYLEGVDRFYQVHLTKPGEIDIAGAAIMGAPMVLIGFNNNLAWAHTVSTARRFGFYRLQLAADDPTSYIFDGQRRAMEATEITVEMEDGTTATRTLYRSHLGPMINLSGLSPALAWNSAQAVTIRDVNLENPRSFRNFLAWNHAQTLQDFIDAKKSILGIPWVNTSAAGRDDGRAFYSDITVVPNLPDSLVSLCSITELAPALPLLAGNTSACTWRTDADSPQPGAFGVSKLPSLESPEYVANMNDSYWLSNPNTPLTGYDRVIGAENNAQSLRTRMGHTQALELVANPPVTSAQVREEVISSRVYSAEQLKDDLLATACTGNPIDVDGTDVDVTVACSVLDAWDNTGNLDARGALIWSQFWNRARNLSNLYTTPFNAMDPINTPNGLNTANADVIEAFGAAVQAVNDSGLPLDAQVRDYQTYPKQGVTIPLFGGSGNEGYFTVLNNTYMHVVDFPDGQPVRAYTFVAHSQSTDPNSPHFADYTQAYSDKQWNEFPFTREAIEASLIAEPLQLEE